MYDGYKYGCKVGDVRAFRRSVDNNTSDTIPIGVQRFMYGIMACALRPWITEASHGNS